MDYDDDKLLVLLIGHTTVPVHFYYSFCEHSPGGIVEHQWRERPIKEAAGVQYHVPEEDGCPLFAGDSH